MACCIGVKRRSDGSDPLDPLNTIQQLRSKRRRLKYGRVSPSDNLPLSIQQQNQKLLFSSSPFSNAVTPQATTETISSSIREEMIRFQNRRQLHFETSTAASPPPQSATTSGTDVQPTKTSPSKDKPLFTFGQVTTICERMLTEQEKALRETYENALTSKLNEQYDTFVKFTHDQLRVQRGVVANDEYSYMS